MDRNALKSLEKWKNSPNRKPLIIQGARQVGKTWLIKEFGSRNYKNVAYLSFVDNPNAEKIFQGDFNLENLLTGIELLSQTKIDAENTLIVFDEIQECGRALTALKFFNENAKNYHIISAGSLLGVAVRKRRYSFPVGQVDFLNLYPLTFTEFLEALGEKELLKLITNKSWEMINVFHDKYVYYLKLYFFIGGMPESVQSFLQYRNFEEVRKIQRNILLGYQEDFSKYTEGSNIPKIMAVWNCLPSQLAKENKKFLYKDIQKGARAREFENAIEWLLLTGLIYKVPRINQPNLPISAYQDNAFKLYGLDTGLLATQSGLDAKVIMEGDSIFKEFKGALTEQFVLQELKAISNSTNANGSISDLPIYYWGRENAKAELDFVIQKQNLIIPIEVKASINLKARSLAVYRNIYQPQIAIRTSLANFEVNQGLHNVPLYLLARYLGLDHQTSAE